MFKHTGSNEHQINYQRIATRLYIAILFITFVIFIIYTMLIEDIHSKTVLSPTESDYNQLEQTYTDNLFCPCSSISMNYSIFMNIEPSYHQVCSSDFVSAQWIDYNSRFINTSVIYSVNDYRIAAASQFQLLAMFCQQTRQTVEDNLHTFLQTQFISSQVISQYLFESKGQLLIRDWQSSTLNTFLRTIKLIRVTNYGNQLMSGTSNIIEYYTNTSYRDVKMGFQQYLNCSCALSPLCRTPISIDDIDPNTHRHFRLFSLPNFFIGCSSIEALLKSTLECFYSRSCLVEIDNLINFLRSPFNFSTLNATLNSPNETIELIVNRLMVDSWSSNVSFPSYYKTCAPQSCTFEYMGRNDIFSVFTSILSVFGGLSVALKIITLLILRCIEKIMNNLSFHALIKIIRSSFGCYTQQQMIHRLHLFFISMILYVIFIFSAYAEKSTTVEVLKPSLSTYQRLTTHYSTSLQCSCSQISIPYQSFLTILPRFHHLCSSEFVSDDWIIYLYGQGDLVFRFPPTDFRASATGQFILLASLCQLSQETVNETLSQLLTSDFINAQLLSENLLNEQIRTMINEFQSATPNLFLNILNLIRETTGANMIISGWSTNWVYITENVIHPGWTAHTTPVEYDGCSCGSSWKCTQPSRGMMAGCYPLEALLRSTLQCFYDQDCIDSSHTFTKLNISLLQTSRFPMNATIESILNNLMVEEYESEMTYEKYFGQCSPSSCTYSYVKSHDATEAALSLISLYGGLVIITQCFTVIIVKLFCRPIRQVNPETIELDI